MVSRRKGHRGSTEVNIRQFFASMSQRARIAFGAGLLLIACLVGVGLWWIAHPPYGVLYGNLREADAAEITATLGQMQVPYRLTDQGKVILVPSDQVYETRMQLVSRGVPKGVASGSSSSRTPTMALPNLPSM